MKRPRALFLLGMLAASVAPSVRAEFTPIRIVQDPPLEYPTFAGLNEMPDGSVTFVIEVDGEGTLRDALAIEFTRREFARYTQDFLERWTYQPATRDGQPVAMRQEVTFRFRADGHVQSLYPATTPEIVWKNLIPPKDARRLVSRRELDAPLQPIEAVSPRPIRTAEPVSAVVDFYVDEEGMPRMPVVVRAETREAGLSALEAVRQWRFEPPTVRRQPVLTRVKQEFRFPATQTDEG